MKLSEVKRIIKEQLSFVDNEQKYEFSYNELNILNNYINIINKHFDKQNNNTPEFTDVKNRVKKIKKIINNKFN